MNNTELVIKIMAALAESMAQERKHHERYHCMSCGAPITEWEDTEEKEKELIFTYRCAKCGCYAE